MDNIKGIFMGKLPISINNESKYKGAFDIDELVANTSTRLKKFISRRVYNQSDVDDLVQMTYLEAFRNQHKFIGASSKETWLFGIASNLVRNHFKKTFSKPEMVALDDVTFLISDQIFNPDYINEHKIQLSETIAVVESLPLKMQSVIYHIMDSDNSYNDAAEQLGIPIGTIRSRLSRVRKILKSNLEKG
ncbi:MULTISPECIES: RNA polymerase sigma factor [Kosakonia]|uniref:RNA polymerase sigma factor n=1 Tax=Kosakonia sacchari TaxID=1158459 RepID=A0ABZ0MR44_9ENTR|nr:RNA polymerase sigma factor [Kosakonia sacchari]WOZ77523.1 RNA polymerase sigma factor [Kosakonia sacchari]